VRAYATEEHFGRRSTCAERAVLRAVLATRELTHTARAKLLAAVLCAAVLRAALLRRHLLLLRRHLLRGHLLRGLLRRWLLTGLGSG
jgi:hypothetical protein